MLINKTISNNCGSALMSVLMFGFLIAAAGGITIMYTNNSMGRIRERKTKSTAFNIAEAGKEHVLAKLKSNQIQLQPNTRNSVFYKESFSNGTYTVSCSTNSGIDSFWIVSDGMSKDEHAQIEILCVNKTIKTKINPNIQAAVTTRSDVNLLGSIKVDGCDWNASGDSVVGIGVAGVRSCGKISQGGNSYIGGAGASPKKNAGFPIVDQYVNAGNYPKTPEEALGIPSGSLDKYKTNVMPSLPFSGIVYFTGNIVQAPNFGGSSGIFICHNASRTAKIKNFHGNFRGIVISDQLDHINGTGLLLGALVTLSSQSGTNALGNGKSNIKYSSAVIAHTINSYTIESPSSVKVVSWLQNK